MEIQYVADAMRSGRITTGPRTKELEKKLAAWVCVSRMMCLNSQTAAAEASLRVLGIGEGDEANTRAYTYTVSASVAIHVGARVVLADCPMKPGPIEMDYDALEIAGIRILRRPFQTGFRKNLRYLALIRLCISDAIAVICIGRNLLPTVFVS